MSAYLDNMDVLPGAIVVCKADITGVGFTPGKTYKVEADGFMHDDSGYLCIPSARFDYENKTDIA